MEQLIGRYKVIERIGAGGMGTVYRAFDPAMYREVALKLLLPNLGASQSLVARFQREAQVVARLEHPHIVPIYDVGEHQGQQFIVMRLLTGGTLQDRLARRNFDTRQIMVVTDQICGALEVAHERGIVHRDLKPANVLFDDRDQAFLSDFGVAKVLDASVQLTGTGLIGTPSYMSPEQFSGTEIDGRSDQYSLAVVLFEALSGRLPFTGDTMQVMYKHTMEPPPDIRTVNAALPQEISPVLNRALAKRPDDRYPTIQAFNRAVQDALAPLTSAATLVVPWEAAATATVPGATQAAASGAAGPLPGATPAQAAVAQPVPSRSRRGPLLLAGGLILFVLLCGGGAALLFGGALGTDGALGALFGGDPTATATESAEVVADLPATETDTPTATATATEEPPATATTPPSTATATERPTGTPRPATATATRAATATAEATATATTAPTPDDNPVNVGSSGGGLPLGFETFGVWSRGDQPNGTFTQSRDVAHDGSSSAKLAYDFPGSANDFVVFTQVNPIPGEPNTINAWVYGDGSGHYLNAWIVDDGGQTWQVPLGRVTHTNWRQMSGVIDTDQEWPWTHISGPDNETVDYPIRFRGFVLDDRPDSFQGDGEIYIDEVTATTGPGIVATPGAGGTPGATPSGTGTPAATIEPGAVGRILFTVNNVLYTTDPDWSSAQEVGPLQANTCSSQAVTTGGQSFPLYRGPVCVMPDNIGTCKSPDGQYEVIMNAQPSGQTALNVRTVGDPTEGIFIYQGTLDRAQGVRWSPFSNSFLFVEGSTVHRGFPVGGQEAILSAAAQPQYASDASAILYLSGNDVYVSGPDGTGARNVTNTPATPAQCPAWRAGN